MKTIDIAIHTGVLYAPSAVYHTLTDYEHAGEWFPEIQRFRSDTGGTHHRLTFRWRPFIISGLITQEVPDEHILMQLDTEPLTGSCEWQLQPGDMGTALTIILRAKIQSIVHQGLLLIRNYEYLIRNDCRQYFRALTQELERRTLTSDR